MTTYVAMLRAVNVGGATVAMADLRKLAESAGFEQVSTHLNSGNLLFTATGGGADKHAETISAAIGELVGRQVPVIVRTPAQLQKALDAARAAFPHGNESQVAVGFLSASAGRGAADRLGEWESEEYLIAGDAVYLHYPQGQGRSKFTISVIEKKLGLVATVRGIKTVAGLIARAPH